MKPRETFVRLALTLLVFLAGLLGCAELAGAQTADSTYKTKCAACHGADGKGNTPIAQKLGVRDFGSPEVQKETDDELAQITAKGKNKMPGYASSLKDPEIKALVAYIRDLAKKK